LAKVRAAEGKYAESIDLYQKAIAIVPFPEYAAALGDIYTKLNRTEEAKKEFDLVEFIAYLSAINKTLYNRELALYYADHSIELTESLALARKELEVRQDIYTWDVLAWALYKNGAYQDAEAAMQKALKPGTKDALLFFHAGMIYKALHETPRSIDNFERALATNHYFHITYAGMAEAAINESRAHENPTCQTGDSPCPITVSKKE